MIGKYKNGNYSVIIYKDGTKIRYTEDDDFCPDFAESIDCCITKKCNENCPFCYENCSKLGKHAELMLDENTPAQNWISSLHKHTEIALNGNDLDHPELEWFLNYLKKQQIIANITVNQNQFIKNYNKLLNWYSNGLYKGLGVSINDICDELIDKLKTIPTSIIHVIIGIIDEEQINILKNKNLSILFLGYKKIGRGELFENKHSSSIQKNTEYLKNNIEKILSEFKIISFDNLALTQLNIKQKFKDKIKWDEFYAGDDGQFTFYIDAVSKKYSKNSREPLDKRFNINDLNIDEMFNKIRGKN